jgi:hypothetical protein
MRSFSFSMIIYQGRRRVAECGPFASEMGGAGGVSVYITKNCGRSFCLPTATVSFRCPGMSSNYVTTRLVAPSARSFPLMFVCPLILCSIMGSPSLIMLWREDIVVAIWGL